jgi:hypothetical protein
VGRRGGNRSAQRTIKLSRGWFGILLLLGRERFLRESLHLGPERRLQGVKLDHQLTPAFLFDVSGAAGEAPAQESLSTMHLQNELRKCAADVVDGPVNSMIPLRPGQLTLVGRSPDSPGSG